MELIKEIKRNDGYKVPLMLVTNYRNIMGLAVKIGAVLGYGKDKLYDKEIIKLIEKVKEKESELDVLKKKIEKVKKEDGIEVQ